ncbi:MAG TPA: hypothetical protein VF384_02800 [Planctomycetota bacterium]
MLVDHDIDGGEAADGPVGDETAGIALATIGAWFEKNSRAVTYSRQLEVLHEERFFHWVTNKAIQHLVAAGTVAVDKGAAGAPNVLFHRSHRYPRRASAKLRELIAEHSHPDIGHQIGQHAELLVSQAFFEAGFQFVGKNVSELDGVKWTESDHDLDFVFQRDGRRYGIEIKNKLGYANLGDELRLKARIAKHLGCVPLHVVRFLPKTWIFETITSGGFVLVFKWQLYHPAHQGLADRLAKELRLPVRVTSSFSGDDLARFLSWHAKKVETMAAQAKGRRR